MYQNIAVIYDDTPESRRALASAIPLARTFGSSLAVIILMAQQPAYSAYAEVVIPNADRLLEEGRLASYAELQKSVAKAAEQDGVQPAFHYVASGEHLEVISLLQQQHTSLLVVGLHHKGPIISRLWRSIYSLAENAPCNVLGVH